MALPLGAPFRAAVFEADRADVPPRACCTVRVVSARLCTAELWAVSGGGRRRARGATGLPAGTVSVSGRSVQIRSPPRMARDARTPSCPAELATTLHGKPCACRVEQAFGIAVELLTWKGRCVRGAHRHGTWTAGSGGSDLQRFCRPRSELRPARSVVIVHSDDGREGGSSH
jgi:hypothetical protein